MKKLIIYLSCLWLMCVAQPTYGFITSIIDGIKTVDLIIQVDELQDVSLENQIFINKIKNELGITHPITIKRMNSSMLQSKGHRNAFVHLGRYLVISEKWFDTLPEDEKRALIGHELMHIKKHHWLKRIGAFLGTATLVSLLHSGLKELGIIQTKKWSMQTMALFAFAESIALSALSRKQEREADIESAKALNTAQGQIKLHLGNLEAAEKSTGGYHLTPSFLRSHPTTEERIAYLENFKNEHTVFDLAAIK